MNYICAGCTPAMEMGRASICSAGCAYWSFSGGRGGTSAGTGSSEVVGTRINHHFSFEAVSMVVVVWPLLSRVPPERLS